MSTRKAIGIMTEFLESESCKAWFRLIFLALMCALCLNVGQLVALMYVDVCPTYSVSQNMTEDLNRTIDLMWR